jgi:hypothetical protein
VVPKHRRSDEPSLVSVGAPVNRTKYGLDAVGYYPASNGHSRPASGPGWAEGQEGYDWQEWQDWHDWAPPPTLSADHPSAPVPRIQYSADHPSGPMPVPHGLIARGPADTGSRPLPAIYDQLRPLPPVRETDDPGGRGSAVQPARGPRGPRNSGRHESLRATETAGYVAAAAAGAAAGQVHPGDPRFQREPGLPRRQATGFQREPGLPRREATGFQREPGLPRREATGFQREPGLPRREANGYQRQAGSGWQETTDYRRETGPFGPGPGPAAGRYQNGRSAGGDSSSRTGAVRVAQEAHDDAAAIREAAQLEAATITQHATGQAAAIREAAERDAADMRARLDSMLDELNRMTGYVTEGLATPTMPGTAPALPGAEPGLPRRPRALPTTAPALPRPEPGQPGRTSARPAAAPVRPGAGPGLPGRTSARPAARPAEPGARPGGPVRPKTASPGQAQKGRQARAMRVFVWATAAALAFATISATTEIAEHGFSFFTFRNGGTGETPGTETDQQFEALQQKAPAHPAATHKATAPKGKHHKTS